MVADSNWKARLTRGGWLLLAAGLLCSTFLPLRADESPAPVPAPKDDIDWTGIPKVDPDQPTLHRGVVLGPDGDPLAGASIYAASTIELLELADADDIEASDLGPVRAVTDEKGRFEFHAKDISWVTPAGVRKRWETLLVATKEGISPGWLKTWGQDRGLRSHWHPHIDKEVAVRMRPKATLTGRLLLEDGTPLAGARVRLAGIRAPRYYDLEEHIEKEVKPQTSFSSGPDYAETIAAHVLPGLKTEATANDDGRFELRGLPEGFIASIEVTHPKAVTTDVLVAVRQIETVYGKKLSFRAQPDPDVLPELVKTPSLYGSGFTAELPKGAVLRGRVTVTFGFDTRPAAGVIVGRANRHETDGMVGQQFRTDAKGRFVVTGLPKNPAGYELAFAGSFEAPVFSERERVVPGVEANIRLRPAVPYRLKLADPAGNPVDRDVYSIEVQEIPGRTRRDIKSKFNIAERVAPGVYQGIVPHGPAAVLVDRHKADRPAAVDPKEFFAPGRTDWTLEEERFAYGDAWRIARPTVLYGSSSSHEPIKQLELAAVVFTNANLDEGVLELTATVYPAPPVEVTLVDNAGKPVAGASLTRRLEKYEGEDLPATVLVYGLHPERAEMLRFRHSERGLIGTISATWTSDPIRVVMRPVATLIGRITDASGKPNRDDFIIRVLGEGVMPDTYIGGKKFGPVRGSVDRDGKFDLVVPSGLEVRGEFVRRTPHAPTRPSVGTAFGPLTPKPGETVELGDLVVP